jgi:CRP-like cAMP-binding protein
MNDPTGEGRRNRVLAKLPDDAYRECLQALEPVELSQRQVLFEHNARIMHVYFPLNSVASLLIQMDDGAVVECATVGNEGVVGLPVFLGAHSLPMRAIAQVPGQALQMDAETFRQLLARRDGPLQTALHRYTQAIFSQLAQNVACNQLHTVEQRCARWLLMTADRAEGPKFLMTQEFLAQTLGVRRASVSEVASRLADEGRIRYNRGTITVVDRSGLERTSCGCYRAIRSMYERMLGSPGAAAQDAAGGTVPVPR